MRILFMGTPYFAQIVLQNILSDSFFELVGLFAQPDKPFGRTKALKSPHTKELILQKNLSIPIYQPKSLDDEVIKKARNLKPDIILVVAYGKILPKSFLSIARCVNIHASILPKYRGASPIHEMILNDDKILGVSVIDMQEGLDDGDILGISTFERKNMDDFETLSEKLAQMGATLAIEILKNIDTIKPVKQIQADATYCKKICKNDGLVKFENARMIYLKSLAYSKWPNVFLENGLKLFDIEIVSETNTYKKGEILGFKDNGVLIGCAYGALKINKLQAPSKQAMDAKSYIQGKRLKIGDILV